MDCDELAQVAGHRLLGGHDVDGLLFELDLARVDLVVGVNHRLGSRGVASPQGFHGALDRLVDHRSDEQDLVLEFIQTLDVFLARHERLPP